jgi:peptidoglycan hydrolase-like protein with peptidoglycan-binding domain
MNRMHPVVAAIVATVAVAACQTTESKPAAPVVSSTASPTAAAEQTALAPDFIRDIQRRLAQRGYQIGPVDGVFGPSTQTALRSFQKDVNLPANGQIDSQTLAVLGVPSATTAGRANAATGQQRSELPAEPYTPTNRR